MSSHGRVLSGESRSSSGHASFYYRPPQLPRCIPGLRPPPLKSYPTAQLNSQDSLYPPLIERTVGRACFATNHANPEPPLWLHRSIAKDIHIQRMELITTCILVLNHRISTALPFLPVSLRPIVSPRRVYSMRIDVFISSLCSPSFRAIHPVSCSVERNRTSI